MFPGSMREQEALASAVKVRQGQARLKPNWLHNTTDVT
jgi:hypothetical protein